MNKLVIKQAFFKELNSGLPEIPNIKPFKKTPMRKVLPFSIIFSSVAATAALAIILTVANRQNPNEIFNISPKPDQTAVQRGENSDWKTFIKAKRGPLEKQELEIAFCHGNWFANALLKEAGGPVLDYFNGEQMTTLKLMRIVNYEPVSIYEHTATLYENVCGDMFSSSSNFTFVDSITVDDLKQLSPEEEGSIGYYIRIESIDGGSLEFSFEGDVTKEHYIVSSNNSYINYEITNQEIMLFPN